MEEDAGPMQRMCRYICGIRKAMLLRQGEIWFLGEGEERSFNSRGGGAKRMAH